MQHNLARITEAGRSPRSPRLATLFAPLDFLLAGGGDTRLTLAPDNRLNAYGCRPYPRPEAFTFASSTATSISERGYARADRAREALIAACVLREDAFDARLENLRASLLRVLGLESSGTDVVFSPSGTDAQLQALFATRALMDGPLTAIIVAADETGSGTALAITGRHFNTITALGHEVDKGTPLGDLGADVVRIDIAANDASGHPRPLAEIDRDVMAAVAEARRDGRRVLLQTMDRSKLWRRAPSEACIGEIAARWAEDVQIVVDACQMRLSPARIAAHLKRGAMVLLTGSKFFTGPPFSGALLVPKSLSQRLAGFVSVPEELGDYAYRGDWPLGWSMIRSQLAEGFNPGQWLRWEAALAEMEAYAAVPQDFRTDAIARFTADAAQRIAAAGLTLIDEEPRDDSDAIDDGEFTPRTILPFLMHRDGTALPRAAVAGLYRALNCDITPALPPNACAEEKRLAAQLCHIGQPVAVRDRDGSETAVLRISAGARVLSDSWDADRNVAEARLAGECEQVGTILAKLSLLLRHQITA